tara:strand:+ start:684 stop:1205 length:522 start_codon:yes stop_codon:yes gene_type:complete
VINHIKYFLIIILLLLTTNSYSQNIAYANLDKIVKNSTSGKKIIEYYQKINTKIVSEIRNKEKNIKEKERSLISQKNILEATEYNKKVNLLREEINIFNNENKTKLNEINQDKEKSIQSFMSQVNEILNDYAKKKNIDIILSSQQIVIGKSELDVTNDILKIVNKKINNFKIN